jgi:serine/threonine protein phosphatase PrpC
MGLPLFPRDILLVCTDGLYRSLSIAEMKDIFSIAVDAEECVKQLLNKPSLEVSSDDATVIVAFV